MRRIARFRTLVAIGTLGAVLASGSPAAGSVALGTSVDVEQTILQLVNATRSRHGLSPYALHAGLRDVAREHSQGMAAVRRLSHDGFEGRLARAVPDPYESNGGSDDGIWGAWLYACENAAYHFRAGSGSESAAEVARNFERQWYTSPGHRNCVLDAWGYGLNAAGIGVYRDASGVWWATMEVAYDATPPAGLSRCAADGPSVSVNLCG